MKPRRWSLGAVLLLASVPISAASARGLSVEVATDRGHNAVYRTGDPLVIEARTSHDAHLLVYEIDAEGYVRLLFPERHEDTRVVGGSSYYLPDESSAYELVVQGPDGQGHVVAIASEYRFRDLPWYLRPYDAHAEEMGYDGEADDEAGVTAEGRIVGDPFVAMERIRRRVLEDPEDDESFATAYTTYYVGHEVRYPRYLCYDCHRPGYWAWWSSFDPYHHRCSVFDFRVNWGWTWGPSYWYGHVPYYVFVYRNDCPPRYRVFGSRNLRHSSWDGWRRWTDLWGGPLRRYKSDPPPRTTYDPSTRWPKDGGPGVRAGGSRAFRGGIVRNPRVRDDVRNDRGTLSRRDARARATEIRERMKATRAGVRDPRRLADVGDRRGRGDVSEPRRRSADPGGRRQIRDDRSDNRRREVRDDRPDNGRRETRENRSDARREIRDTRDWRSEQGRREYRVPPREERGTRERRDSGSDSRRDSGERSGERRRDSRSWLDLVPRPLDAPRAQVVRPDPPAFDAPRPGAYDPPRPVEPRPVRADAPAAAPARPAPPPEVSRPPVSPDVFRHPRPEAVRRVERDRRE